LSRSANVNVAKPVVASVTVALLNGPLLNAGPVAVNSAPE